MTTATTNLTHGTAAPRQGFLSGAEAWLDARGKGAWIAATVVGFIAFWPIGLALLAYMVFVKRTFSGGCASRGAGMSTYRSAMKSSGNNAFDAYKAETLRRLEQEQSDFEAFLARLREAKDKAEFDQFMEDRARKSDDENGDDRDAA